MGRMLQGVRLLNCVSVVMFLVSCYYMCVSSEQSPPSVENKDGGALTVVPKDEDEDNGVEVAIEDDKELDFSSEVKSIFYPTNEWKPVKPGQAIPKGLHVRLNMETGEKEAKLMDNDDGMKYWKLGDKEGMVNTDKKYFTTQELKKALKEFKTAKIDEPADTMKAEELKNKFRSYKELKKDFADMNVAVKTDAEIITDLVNMLKQPILDKERKMIILEDLEYYLHQIDNAQLFCDVGGMEFLVKGLNDTDADTRLQSAFVLGSALQSNPKVQIFAIESGAMQQLIRALSIESHKDTRKKILYAISSMIRHFPFAQRKFLELGGMSALMMVLDNNEEFSLKVKIVTLLSDLITEQELAAKHSDNSEKQKQYQLVHIKEAIIEKGFCGVVPGLLQATDHDSREKVLHAMVMLDPCKDEFLNHYQVLDTLYSLQKEYTDLIKEDIDDDKYFEQILSNVNNLIAWYNTKLEL